MLLLLACTMEENSLEPASLVPQPDGVAGPGTLSVTAGAAAGDWTLGIGEGEYQLHSPSHVDMAAYAGLEVTLSESGKSSWQLDGPDGTLYLADANETRGTFAFGREVWSVGATLGDGTQSTFSGDDEETDIVTYVAVDVATDDGTVSLEPGAPARVVIDGVTWRMTVLGAYKPHPAMFSACAMESVISVELARTEADPGPALVRPAGLTGIRGSCG